MTSAERSDVTTQAIASLCDIAQCKSAEDVGLTAAPQKRSQLFRLADVVGVTNHDFRRGLVDVAKVNNVERMLRRRLSKGVSSLSLKRLLDIVGATSAILLLLPLLALAALAVKSTTSGPIIFTQWRYGLDGKPFRILKFRTLYSNCCDGSGVSQTVLGDRRVTPIGRILRQTNIDELPQLVNVLLGDMSLVGPRPHPIGMRAAGCRYEDLVLVYPFRVMVRPGITGLAQMRGFRGPTTDRKSARMRIVCDLAYVARISVLLDLKIILFTVLRELRGGTGG